MVARAAAASKALHITNGGIQDLARTGKGPVYVAWEKRDVFSGEDQPATPYAITWGSAKATATDIFGATVATGITAPGQLSISVSGTPVFIEGMK